MDGLPNEKILAQTFPRLFDGHTVRPEMHAGRLRGQGQIDAVINETWNAKGTRHVLNLTHETEQSARAKVFFPNLEHQVPFGREVPEDLPESVLTGLMSVGDDV